MPTSPPAKVRKLTCRLSCPGQPVVSRPLSNRRTSCFMLLVLPCSHAFTLHGRSPFAPLQTMKSVLASEQRDCRPRLVINDAMTSASDLRDRQRIWAEQWWPLCFSAHTTKRKPYPITLLGAPVVLWWDGGAWRCTVDRCSHRLAPLSEGRVTTEGCLECPCECHAPSQAPSQVISTPSTHELLPCPYHGCRFHRPRLGV